MVFKSSQETEEEKLSKINAAGIINITLENLWKDCYNALCKSDYLAWNRKLDAIWLILGGDDTDGSQEKKMNEIDTKLYTTGSLNHRKVGFEIIGSEEQDAMNLQYLILKQKSLLLRKMQNKQGKGTAYISDDLDDMD